jgi:hypothetical protein
MGHRDRQGPGAPHFFRTQFKSRKSLKPKKTGRFPRKRFSKLFDFNGLGPRATVWPQSATNAPATGRYLRDSQKTILKAS